MPWSSSPGGIKGNTFLSFSQNDVNVFVLQFVHEKEIVAEDDQVFLMKQQVIFYL